MHLFLQMIGYTFIMSITPGPNNVICLAIGSTYDYKAASKYIIGVVIGCLTMQWIFLGIHHLLSEVIPVITDYISYLGLIYMLYLAYKISRNSTTVDTKEISKPIGTMTGIFLQFINPKAYIFNATIVTSYITLMSLSFVQYMLLTMVTGIIFFSCCSTWALFGFSFQKFLSKYGRLLNYALSLCLVYLAIALLL